MSDWIDMNYYIIAGGVNFNWPAELEMTINNAIYA